MNEKNTPRDFFLHTGAFVTLYCGAIALLILLFSVIDYVFPDPLQNTYYYDPYTGPMRFAIASLLVLAPICLYLFFIIQNEARVNPDRKKLGVSKWLTYITLFVAGATVVGDLITLLNSFLGGELPTTFLLKVLSILAVMAAGFAYFLFDIKGYWITHTNYSRYIGLGVLGVVLASIIGGIALIGSPMTQRALRVDNQQVVDLENVSQALLQYWQHTKTLPKDLTQLENDLTGYRTPQSPEGQTAYEYTALNDTSFKLCATFLQPSNAKTMTYPQMQQEGFINVGPQWEHPVGHACFTRTIDPKLFTPVTNTTTKPLDATPTPVEINAS